MLVNLCKKEGITILDIEGRVAGEDSLALRDIIDGRIAAAIGKKVKLILKLEKVRMIDGTGLGALVAACTAIKQRGGRIALLNAGIKNLIVMTKLMMFFERYENEDEAIASFQ